MRTIEVPIYTYDELSQSAKDRVKQWLNEDDWGLTELLESDLSDHYCIPDAKLSYSLASCQGDGVSFTGQWEGEEMLSIISKAYEGNVPPRLAKALPYFTLKFTRISHHYAHAYTVQTELYSDRYLSDNIYRLIEQAEKVINNYRISICKSLDKTGYAEIEYQYTDEYASETCKRNDYEFYEDGSLV